MNRRQSRLCRRALFKSVRVQADGHAKMNCPRFVVRKELKITKKNSKVTTTTTVHDVDGWFVPACTNQLAFQATRLDHNWTRNQSRAIFLPLFLLASQITKQKSIVKRLMVYVGGQPREK